MTIYAFCSIIYIMKERISRPKAATAALLSATTLMLGSSEYAPELPTTIPSPEAQEIYNAPVAELELPFSISEVADQYTEKMRADTEKLREAQQAASIIEYGLERGEEVELPYLHGLDFVIDSPDHEDRIMSIYSPVILNDKYVMSIEVDYQEGGITANVFDVDSGSFTDYINFELESEPSTGSVVTEVFRIDSELTDGGVGQGYLDHRLYSGNNPVMIAQPWRANDTCDTFNPRVENFGELDYTDALDRVQEGITSKETPDSETLHEALEQLKEIYGIDFKVVTDAIKDQLDIESTYSHTPYDLNLVEDADALTQTLLKTISGFKIIPPEVIKLSGTDVFYFSLDIDVGAGYFNSESEHGNAIVLSAYFSEGIVSHELGHAIDHQLCGYQDFYNDESISGRNSIGYVGHESYRESTTGIAPPELNQASSLREFEGAYGQVDVAEDRATIWASLLVYRGAIQPGDPDYGSPFHLKQLTLTNRLESVMPGFKEFIAIRTEEIRSQKTFDINEYFTDEELRRQSDELEESNLALSVLGNKSESTYSYYYYEDVVSAAYDEHTQIWHITENPFIGTAAKHSNGGARGGDPEYDTFRSLGLDKDGKPTVVTHDWLADNNVSVYIAKDTKGGGNILDGKSFADSQNIKEQFLRLDGSSFVAENGDVVGRSFSLTQEGFDSYLAEHPKLEMSRSNHFETGK